MPIQNLLFAFLSCTLLSGAVPAFAGQCDPSRGSYDSFNECYVYNDHADCQYDSFLECYVLPRGFQPKPQKCDSFLHQFDDPLLCRRYYGNCNYDWISQCFVPADGSVSPTLTDPDPQQPKCDPSRGEYDNAGECYIENNHNSCNYDSFRECYVIPGGRPVKPKDGCDAFLHQFDDPITCQRYYSWGCEFDLMSRCFVPKTEEERCSSQASRWITREKCERESGRDCYQDTTCWSPVPLPVGH